MSYKPKAISGDYKMQCDVCGFDYRASQMRKRFDGLWVCSKDWEPRHPQERLRARRDKMSVPVARPDGKTSPNSTTLSLAALKGDLTITVTSAGQISNLDGIAVVLDNGDTSWTFVNGTPVGSLVTLNDYLWGAAAAGNTVYLSSATGDNWGTTVSASDL